MARLHNGRGSSQASKTAQANTGAIKMYVHDSVAGPHNTIHPIPNPNSIV
jgi:hypothetical protein